MKGYNFILNLFSPNKVRNLLRIFWKLNIERKDLLNFLDIAIKESVKALNANEVPIGSVVVCNKSKKVISKAYNMTEKLGDPTAHAEIFAIQKAAKKIGDWRLDDYSIFTTIEPCDMCMEVIKAARIKKFITDLLIHQK